MKKKNTDELIQLTQECLIRFWHLDAEFAISYFKQDITWVGAQQCQFRIGFEEAAADLRASAKELKRCNLSACEFLVTENTGNCCAVIGRYLVTTDESTGYHLQVQQRCVFIWELIKGEYKLQHITVSNPIGEMQNAPGEMFVNAMGKLSMKYMERRLSALRKENRLSVQDERGGMHFLLLEDIAYVTAMGRTITILTRNGDFISARMNFTEFRKHAGDIFFFVHRSYAVNPECVSLIRQYEIVLSDGTVIPVPAKRYSEIKEKLAAYFTPDGSGIK